MATVGSLAIILTASATDFERTMGRAARAVKSTEKEFMQSARRMEEIGRRWSLGVTLPIIAGLTAVNKAAIDWEDTFAGVRKTVDATEEQFAELDQSLRKMTERIPITHREIGQIAEAAGQLGIQVENIEDFTETMAMLGTATNMASDEAAIALAQMDNIMKSGQSSFDRYGATVVHLGNNLATMESNIVEFGKRIAAAGRIAGLTEAQVLSIGGAFASAGVEAEAGGTAVSKVLAGITEAVATNNKNLKGFATVAGMSAAEFATAWREDAGLAFTRFVEGLGRSGEQAYGILRALGLNNERLKRAFLSVADAGRPLAEIMEMGNKAWEENTALINEANERYKTARSRLIMLGNRVKNAAISFGEALAPMLELAMDYAEKLIGVLQRLSEWFERLPAPVRSAAGAFLVFLAAIGPAYLVMAYLNKVIAGGLGLISSVQAFAANAAFAFTAWRGGAATLGEALTYLAGGKIKLVILAIGAAIAAAILLAANWDKLRAFAVAAWNAISAAVLYAGSLIVRGVGLIVTAIGYIIPAVRGAGQALTGLADSLKASAGAALSSARSVASTVTTAAQAAKTQEDMAKSGENAAGAQNELEKAMKSAGKAANKTLMPFDEIHTMQTAMASSPAADLGDLGVPAIEAPQVVAPGIGGIGDIAVGVSDQLSKAAKTAGKAWDTLKQKMEPVNKVIQWIKDNWPTIGPIIENIASIIMVLLVPALIKSGTQAMIAAGKHVLAWTMKGAAALAKGAIIVGQLMLIIAKWAWAGIQALIHAGKIVLAWAMQGWAAVAQGAVMIGQFVLIIAKWAWAGAQALIHAAKMAAAWVVALGPVAWITAAVIALAVLIIAKWDWIKEKTTAIWAAVTKWLSDKWDSIKTKATNIFNTVKNSIINAFDSVKTRISTIWSNIWGTIRSFINKIIDGMNSMIRGMNRLKWDAPDWVPLIGGKKWGISIPLIPKLATGTNYVPRDMLAYLHRGEAVIPKEYNPAAVAGAGGGNAVDRLAKTIARALREAATSGSEQEGPFILQVNIGGNKVLEEIIDAARRKNAKAGRTVIPVGVG